MSEYLDTSRPFPYCPGCGHPHVLRALDAAMKQAGLPASRAVVVSDIGCVGLADPFFPAVHTVHSLHGRSVAVAAGLSLGDRSGGRAQRRGGGPLKPIVLIGDGGTGIGLLHLVHAAQANVDVTVLVHNNLVYGMTGGQHSVLTPPGMKTTTTPEGCPIPPLDLDRLLSGAGAGFFARALAPGDDLAPLIASAIRHPGFACVEVFELCPTFATAKGGLTGRSLKTLPDVLGARLGILRQDASRPAFLDPAGGVGEEAGPAGAEGEEGIAPVPEWRRLDRVAQVVLAGRAGERVQSSALLAASAACCAGLHVTVRSDNPVTQGTGFSLAEITIGPEPIACTSLRAPDLSIVLAPEGAAEMRSRGLLEPGASRRLVLDAELTGMEGAPAAREAFRSTFGAKNAALGALMREIEQAGWWNRRAWRAAIDRLPAARRAEPGAVLAKLS